MNSLSERILEAMRDAGKTQADLSRACGVRPASVSDWISGKTQTMKAAPAMRAAELLGVNVLWLTEGRGQKNKPNGGAPKQDKESAPLEDTNLSREKLPEIACRVASLDIASQQLVSDFLDALEKNGIISSKTRKTVSGPIRSPDPRILGTLQQHITPAKNRKSE